MTQPHQIDREAVAALIDRLRENLSDSAPSRLVCVESADVQSALDTIEALSRPMEAVAWREKVIGLIDRYLHGIEHEETTNPDGWWETSRGADFGAKVKADLKDAILALIATHPVQALDSSLRDTHRAAVTDVLADCPGCGVAPLRLHKADCEIMLSRTPASDTTGGYEAAGQRSDPKSTHPVQGGEG